MLSTDPDIRRIMVLRAIESDLLRLKWLAAATRFEIAMRRHDRALKYAYKYGFNPNQPRVPAGQREGGQWANDGTSSDQVRLAGDIPNGNSPEILKERPPTPSGRTAALKAAARFGGPIGKLIEGAEWLRERSPLIESYRDPPKSFEELQQDVSTPGLGYDKHHVVEQTQAENEGFSREQIDAPENLVRIPRMKHWEINAWYQTENPAFGGETPRDYLSGRSWAVKRAVGLEALREVGVLKP